MPNIWLVDDSPLEAEMVRRTLAPLYRVEVFTDGAAVIEEFASSAPPDAVVLDRQMPGTSGLEVCRFLRSNSATRATPILMLTVPQDTGDLVQCLAAGADDFLSKPCNAAKLSARVAALIRAGQMHERVQAAERAVRSLLMELPDAVMGVDGAGKVTFVNLQAERMLQRRPADVVGRSLGDSLPELRLDTDSGPTDGEAWPERDTTERPDVVLGDRILAPAWRRYLGVDGLGLILSFRDVTTERRHQDERARLLAAESAARAEAERASRAKDEFLAIVSHELRTPLNTILGWTRILRGGVADEVKRSRALETIERSATAQQKLIEDILDVSRIISGKVQIDRAVVDLGGVVRGAVDAVRPAAEAKSIALRTEIAAVAPSIVGDPDRLQQIVWNLLSNAVKFTPAGGVVTVEVRDEGEAAVLVVKDTGPGIPGAFLPYVFDRFRQADSGTTRAHGGLGLGLSIVRHLAEMHGGSVECVSEAGKGAAFVVRLPRPFVVDKGERDSAVPSSRCAVVAAIAEDRLLGLRVLVVDDDPDTRDLLTAMLDGSGAKVRAVGTVSEALVEVQAGRPDVIISDIGIPSEDGYSFVRRLRALPSASGGGTPALAVTAFAAPRDSKRALEAGFDAFLPKPVASVELVRVVVRLAREHRKNAPAVTPS